MKDLGANILFLIGIIIYLIVEIGIYIIIAAIVVGIIWLIITLIKSSSSNNNVKCTKNIRPEFLDEANNKHSVVSKRESDPVATLVTSSINDSVVSNNSHCKECDTLNDFSDEFLAVNPDSFSQNIVNRIRRYQQSFPNSTWSKDSLYAHILGITNNTIKISRHSIDKNAIIRECIAINHIIKLLQNNTPHADIIDKLTQEVLCL